MHQNMKNIVFIFYRANLEILHLKKLLILFRISSERSCLFHKCWQCLNLTKKKDQNFVTVNRECKKFKLNELSPDMFNLEKRVKFK